MQYNVGVLSLSRLYNSYLLSVFPQWAKSRSLHHHREESWLLAAVWWWHCGGASLSAVLLRLMVFDSFVCTSTVCVTTKPHFTYFMQKIDAQAIEEFYGLTSDISKNSESGYILFYQSREWLELDRCHRRLIFFTFRLTDPASCHRCPTLPCSKSDPSDVCANYLSQRWPLCSISLSLCYVASCILVTCI